MVTGMRPVRITTATATGMATITVAAACSSVGDTFHTVDGVLIAAVVARRLASSPRWPSLPGRDSQDGIFTLLHPATAVLRLSPNLRRVSRPSSAACWRGISCTFSHGVALVPVFLPGGREYDLAPRGRSHPGLHKRDWNCGHCAAGIIDRCRHCLHRPRCPSTAERALG